MFSVALEVDHNIVDKENLVERIINR